MWEQLNQAALRLEELETQLAQPETYENLKIFCYGAEPCQFI